VLHQLSEEWSVKPSELVATGERFFKGFKEQKKLQSDVGQLELKACAP
jgi:hypothetical protein